MDKDKQIAELADIIENSIIVDNMGYITHFDTNETSEALYNAGYRKVGTSCTIKRNGESELQKVLDEFLEGNTYVKQRQGEWGFDGMSWTCSECGEYAPIDKHRNTIKSKYCPNCGARMKGE